MQRKKFFEFRWGFITLLTVLLTACGGGGGSVVDTNTPQTTKSTPANLQVAIQSAVMHASVKVADASLTRSTPTSQEFVDTKNSGFSIGDVFTSQQVGYKIIGIIPNPDGTQRIATIPATLKEMYADLNLKIKTNALAYDENNKPITYSQIGLVTRAGMQLGLVNPVGALKKCIQLVGDFESSSGTSGNQNNFGYKFDVNCSLGELLDIDALSAVNVGGTFGYAATTEYFVDVNNDTNYSVADSDVTTGLAIKLEGASFANIRSLTEKSSKCKVKNGQVECEIDMYNSPTTTFVVNGVPITLQAGVRFRIAVNGDGSVAMNFKSGSIRTVGLISGVEKNTSVPKGDNGFSFEPLSFTGELDAYLFGWGSASILGTEDVSVLNGEVTIGGYGTISAEVPTLGSSTGCLKRSTGLRAGVTLEVLKFGNNALFELNGEQSAIWKESSIPKDCASKSKIQLNYLISGKDYYSSNTSISTEATDVYDVSYRLFKLQSDDLGAYFTVSTLPSVAVLGKPIAFDIAIKDFSKNPNIRITKVVSGLREDLNAKIYPGQNTYGDVIKLEMRAYVPGDRAATELVREIQMKIEAPLEARPTYWKEVDTTGNTHWVLDHGFLGDTRPRLKSAVNKFTADGTVNILSHPYTVSVGGVASDASYFDTTSISVLSRNSVTNTPISIGLSSAALKAGSEQLFQYVESRQPSIKTVTYEPLAPQLGDVIAFTVKGDRLPVDMKVTVPNCKYIDERRTKENLQTNTFSTIERVYYCKNTATGVDLVAEFGATPYPVVFSVVEQSTANFVSVPKNPGVGETVAFHLYNIWGRVESVMWSIYGYTLDLVTQVKEGTTSALQAYVTPGVKTIAVAYRDSDGVTLRSREYSVRVGADLQTATIDAAVSNSTTKPGTIPKNGTTDDTTPTLSGTISAPLPSGHNVNVWDGANRLDPAAVVAPGGTTWTFTPATPLSGGLHSFTADVSDPAAMPGARSDPYVVNVQPEVPVANNTIALPATAFVRGVNVALGTNGGTGLNDGFGADTLFNAPPFTSMPNAAEWDFNVPTTGQYELFAEFAALVSRPVTISLNGSVVLSNALSNATGGWYPVNRQYLSQGVVQLAAGANTMRVARNDVFPHIKGFTLVPRSATVPTSTSLNLLLGATVTDSCMFCSNYSVYGDPNYLTDGNITSGRNVGTYSGNFTVALATPSDIGRISLLPNMSPNGVVNFEIQTSTDANGAVGTWTSHGGRLSQSWKSGAWVDVTLNANTTGVRMVRLFVYSSPSWVAFMEVQGYSAVTSVHQGTFPVAANAPLGTAFTIPNGATSCGFTAQGTWTSATWTGNATGVAGATNPTYTWPMPPANSFSLIAKHGTNLSYIGNNASLSVTGGAVLSFLMNDAVGYYGDNSGSIEVAYTCQ